MAAHWKTFFGGFNLTFRHLTRTNVTISYPQEKRPKQPRQHGRHVLNRYEDGMEKCIGCELCAGVCPAKCIYVRGQDNDPQDPTSPGERFGFVYEINYLRCIHCDLCVEACPTEAITETKLFEFAFTNRADAIYTKDELLVDDAGHPQQLPWENWSGGFDPARDSSGWMRATSPSGDADFVGIVAWAGELGYGVRPPQRATIEEESGPVPSGADHGHGHEEAEHPEDHGQHGDADHEDPDSEQNNLVEVEPPVVAAVVVEPVVAEAPTEQEPLPEPKTRGHFDATSEEVPKKGRFRK